MGVKFHRKNILTLIEPTEQNPSVGTSCKLTAGQSYCVERNFGVPNEPTTTKTTSGPGATTTGNGVSTPAPTQPGMIDSCNKFYKTKSGDTCGKVLAANSISLADFYAWNKGVGDNCQFLWLDTNYCIGIIGGATTTKPPGTTSTTTAGNGVATPKPTQDGMTPRCNKFVLTKGGDSCGAISKANGISLADFYDWNSGLGGTCDALWTDTYYCVGEFPNPWHTFPYISPSVESQVIADCGTVSTLSFQGS